MAWWPHDLLQRRRKIQTERLKIAGWKWTFFIATTPVAQTTVCAFWGTFKSFLYIWGYRMRSIHKYKSVFYHTNAYQTNVMVCCAHNKEGWLVHFILWALTSAVEIKNIFTAAIHVSLYKQLPTAVKISWENLCEGWVLWRASIVLRLHEPGNVENYWKYLCLLPKQRGPNESLRCYLASSHRLKRLKSWKKKKKLKRGFICLYTDTHRWSYICSGQDQP